MVELELIQQAEIILVQADLRSLGILDASTPPGNIRCWCVGNVAG